MKINSGISFHVLKRVFAILYISVCKWVISSCVLDLVLTFAGADFPTTLLLDSLFIVPSTDSPFLLGTEGILMAVAAGRQEPGACLGPIFLLSTL